MEVLLIIAGVIIFVLIVVFLITGIMQQVRDLQDIDIPKRNVKKVYVLEVNKRGEVKLKEKTLGGGFDYQKF